MRGLRAYLKAEGWASPAWFRFTTLPPDHGYFFVLHMPDLLNGDCWSVAFTKCPYGDGHDSKSYPTSRGDIGTSSFQAGDGHHGKRRIGASDNDAAQGSDHKRRKSHSDPVKEKTENHKESLLACPFYRVRPEQFRHCHDCKYKSVSDVRRHIMRTHTVHCARCYTSFFGSNAEAQRVAHVRSQACASTTGPPPDGYVTDEMVTQLKAQRRGIPSHHTNTPGGACAVEDCSVHHMPGSVREGKWYEAFDTVLPGTNRPNSPYWVHETVVYLQSLGEGPHTRAQLLEDFQQRLDAPADPGTRAPSTVTSNSPTTLTPSSSGFTTDSYSGTLHPTPISLHPASNPLHSASGLLHLESGPLRLVSSPSQGNAPHSIPANGPHHSYVAQTYEFHHFPLDPQLDSRQHEQGAADPPTEPAYTTNQTLTATMPFTDILRSLDSTPSDFLE